MKFNFVAIGSKVEIRKNMSRKFQKWLYWKDRL